MENEARIRAKRAAHALHAKRDARETTQRAREAFRARFEREVDPEGVLPPAERAKRAHHAFKAYMLGLAYRSAKARRKAGGSG